MAQISIPNSTKQKFLLWTKFHLIYQRSFILFQIRPIIVHIISIIAVKPVFFRVPLISRISRAWQVHENNGPRKFEYSRKQKRQNYGVQNNNWLKRQN